MRHAHPALFLAELLQYLVVPGAPLTLAALRQLHYLTPLPTAYSGQPLMVRPGQCKCRRCQHIYLDAARPT